MINTKNYHKFVEGNTNNLLQELFEKNLVENKLILLKIPARPN